MWWYRLRGWRILGENVWAGGNELDLIVRRGRTLRFVEVKEKRGSRFGDPLEMVTPEKQRRLRRAAEAWLGARPELGAARGRLRRDRRARRPPPARAAGVLASASNPVAWPSRRTSCTRRWTSTSPGPRPSCPSASGRSTSTGFTRTTASSSRSSWRCCCAGTSPPVITSSIPSPVRAPRSSRRSSPASTRREWTSPRSTAS